MGLRRRGAIEGKTTRYGKISYTEASNMAIGTDGLMVDRWFWFTYKIRRGAQHKRKKLLNGDTRCGGTGALNYEQLATSRKIKWKRVQLQVKTLQLEASRGLRSVNRILN